MLVVASHKKVGKERKHNPSGKLRKWPSSIGSARTKLAIQGGHPIALGVLGWHWRPLMWNESIDSFHTTWWPWKPVQLDGHLDWLHIDTCGFLNNYTCTCIWNWHDFFKFRVSKCNQWKWTSNCIGFNGHHVMWNSSIQSCTQNRPSPKVQSRSGGWIELFYRLDYLYEFWHTGWSCSWLQKVPQIF